jgi:DNA polymerase I
MVELVETVVSASGRAGARGAVDLTVRIGWGSTTETFPLADVADRRSVARFLSDRPVLSSAIQPLARALWDAPLRPSAVIPVAAPFTTPAEGAAATPPDTPFAALEAWTAFALGRLEGRGFAVDTARFASLGADTAATEKAARTAFVAEVLAAAKRRPGIVTIDLFGQPDLPFSNDAAMDTLAGELGIDPTGALAAFRAARTLARHHGTLAPHVGADGRIRARFHPTGAPSGRMAVEEPNLQGVPTDAAFRACFAPGPGRVLVTADFSACELRVLADLAGDERLLALFNEGRDVHSAVASWLFDQPVSKTEHPELRGIAKTIAFGLCYGMSAPGLAQRLGLSRDEADDLIRRFFKAMPGVAVFLRDEAQAAVNRGTVITLLGRTIPLPTPIDDEPGGAAGGDTGRALRLARNFPIQGAAAELFKLALVRLELALIDHGFAARDPLTGPVNAVHDELVVECAEADAEAVAALTREAMLGAGRQLLTRVTTEVDVTIQPSWG